MNDINMKESPKLKAENFLNISDPKAVEAAIGLLTNPATQSTFRNAINSISGLLIKCGIGALSIVFQNSATGDAIMVQGRITLDAQNKASLDVNSPLVAMPTKPDTPNTLRPDRFSSTASSESEAGDGWKVRVSAGVPNLGCNR